MAWFRQPSALLSFTWAGAHSGLGFSADTVAMNEKQHGSRRHSRLALVFALVLIFLGPVALFAVYRAAFFGSPLPLSEASSTPNYELFWLDRRKISRAHLHCFGLLCSRYWLSWSCWPELLVRFPRCSLWRSVRGYPTMGSSIWAIACE